MHIDKKTKNTGNVSIYSPLAMHLAGNMSCKKESSQSLINELVKQRYVIDTFLILTSAFVFTAPLAQGCFIATCDESACTEYSGR